MRRALLAAALTVAATAASCGGGAGSPSDRDQVAQVAEGYAQAQAAEDPERLCSYLLPEALPLLRELLGALSEKDLSAASCLELHAGQVDVLSRAEKRVLRRTRASQIRVTGNRATATLGIPHDPTALALRRTADGWRISDLDPKGELAEFAEDIRKINRSRNTARNLDCGNYRFDRAAWRASDTSADPPNPRQRQADALIKCRTLLGLPGEELRQMLGRPDDYVASGRDMSWTLGVQRDSIFPIDNDHLVVALGAGGRVRRAGLESD